MTDRLLENARITLEVSCQAQPDETVLILTDANEFRSSCARAVQAAARELGARPAIMDLADYASLCLRDPESAPVLPPVKAAVEAADVVVRIAGPDYKYLLGDPDAHDQLLTAERRRVHLQSNGDYEGDPEQVQRLKEFIASGDPPAEFIDEVGIVTTQIVANDEYYWSDGTHHHDCVHIALGNNARRDTMVHGPRHMDGDVQRPTIHADDLMIVENGVFLDSVMQNTGG